MTTIPYLQAGDSIGILSTARKISSNELNAAIEIIKSWGLNVIIGKTIDAEENQFAGSDALKIEDFNQMIHNQSIKAIFCARGGYGTVRIIDEIDFDALEKNPKWIIGYSDVTTLHAHIHENTNLSSVHATMPINYPINGIDNKSTESLRELLFGKKNQYVFDTHPLNRNGICEGKLIGGNLSIIYSLLGSSSSYNTKGKILFLEDLDEYLYHIDRMLMNLKRNGLLSELVGIIIGGMSDMNDNTIPFGKNVLEIIKEHIKEYNYPIAFQLPAGHIEPNLALQIGGIYRLEIKNEQSLLRLI